MSTLTSKMQPYINISSFDDVSVIKRAPDVSYRRIDCRMSVDVREATLLNAFFLCNECSSVIISAVMQSNKEK